MLRFIAIGLILGGSLWASRPALAADKKEAEKPIEAAAVELGRPVDFERDIYPILDANCIACHNLAIDESKLVLEDVKSILKGGKRGPSVVAKEPDKSLLYQVASRAKGPVMPPTPNNVEASVLTPQQLGLLRQWIIEGATEGAGSAATVVQWQALPSGLKSIFSTALSPTASLAAAGRANQISIYDLERGVEIATLTDPQLATIEHDGKKMYPEGAAHRDFVNSLAFSPDGSLLASGGFRVVKLWQKPEGVQTAKAATSAPVTGLALSADGAWIAIGTADNAIQVTNRADAKQTRKLTGHTAAVTGLAFSADGKQLVSGSQDKSIRLWNLADGKEIAQTVSTAAINDLALNKEGTLVVTAEADNTLRVWKTPAPVEAPAEEKKEEGKEPEPPKPERELKGHGGPVTSVELILPAATQVISGSEDGTARIWDINNGRQIRSLAHGGPVLDVAASPDGKMLASAGSKVPAKLWDANGKQIAEMKQESATLLELNRLTDDQAVAKQRVALADTAVKASEKNLTDREEAKKKADEAKTAADKAVADPKKKNDEAQKKLKDAQAELAKKTDDAALQKKVADAQKVATAAEAELKKATDAQESAVRALELATKAIETAKTRLETDKKEHEAEVAAQKVADEALAAFQKTQTAEAPSVRAITFSADSKAVFTAGDDQVVRAWGGQSGAPLESYKGHSAAIAELAVTPDGALISASADKSAITWNTRPEWKLVGQLGVSGENPLDVSTSEFESRVLALDFSDDGKLLAAGGGDPSRNGELTIWDVAGRKLVRRIEDAHSDTVMGVEFSRDGKLLLSGAADKFAKIFDVATGKHVRSFEGHTHHVLDVSWKADGSAMVTAGADNAIKAWNVATGEQIRTINNYNKQVTSIVYAGVADQIASGGGDKQVQIHQPSNGRRLRAFSGATDFIYSVDVSRDSTKLIAGGEAGVLRVWNGTNGQVIATFEPPAPATTDATQASAGE